MSLIELVSPQPNEEVSTPSGAEPVVVNKDEDNNNMKRKTKTGLFEIIIE